MVDRLKMLPRKRENRKILISKSIVRHKGRALDFTI